MNNNKTFFVAAYFDRLQFRIEKLRAGKFDGLSLKEESLVLCLLYIDGLASCYYGEATAKAFCNAMRDLSGNPLFAKLHPQKLLDPANDKYWKNAASARLEVEKQVQARPNEMLDESCLAHIIRQSHIPEAQQGELIGNLWRCSIGAICYEYMRCAAVHGLGANSLVFSTTTYEGKQGFILDFDLLYVALENIVAHVARESIDRGEWFANPDYLKG
jgi:hypothetical protein